VALGAAGEDAGGCGELEGLGGEGGGEELDGLEAVVGALAGAGDADEVFGDTRGRGGVAEQDELALEELGGVGEVDLEGVGDVGDVAAVEVAAVEDGVGVVIDERVVAGAVELDLDGGGRLVEDLEEDALPISWTLPLPSGGRGGQASAARTAAA
jgi:hypothetical protein